METIKTYLDNVFVAYPQTNEVKGLKRDMLAHMEEKYAALRQSGKSEHEATYRVIADFGSIEEITAELGFDMNSVKMESPVFLPLDEARIYLSKSMKRGLLIGLGTWLIIAGVSFVVAFNNPFFLFVTVAIAVAMFIISSREMKAYESYRETSIQLDAHSRDILEGEHIRFGSHSTTMTAFGVALIIISVGLFTIINVNISIFLNIIGFSVFLFIVAGCYSSGFDILLEKGNYSKIGKKSEYIISAIAAIYWPLVTAIGLWQLFTGNSDFWIIWPVAGVLFGGICGGVAIWYEMKDKRKK